MMNEDKAHACTKKSLKTCGDIETDQKISGNPSGNDGNTLSNSPSEWTCSDVLSWLVERSYCQQTLQAFSANQIDGKAMISLLPEDLRVEISIQSFSDRRRLMKDIEALKMSDLSQSRYRDFVNLQSTLSTSSSQVLTQDELQIHTCQLDEMVAYEAFFQDQILATKTQFEFNQLLLMDEKDTELVRRLSRLQDDACERCILEHRQSELNSIEERRNCAQSLLELSSKKMVAAELPIEKVPIELRCTSCRDPIGPQYPSLQTACQHNYCFNCTLDWLRSALTDRTLLPIRCCQANVPMKSLEVLYPFLSPEEVRKFQSSTDEKICVNKMYCPVSSCSSFINLDRVSVTLNSQNIITCPNLSCRQEICRSCKTLAHPFISCERNQILIRNEEKQITNEIKQAFGYQQCSKCKSIVELTHGCNHMTCRCKHEFCYRCGKGYIPRQCSCPLYDEDRIVVEQQALIPRNIVGDERNERIQNGVRRRINEIVAEEDCSHRSWKRTEEYSYRRNKPHCHLCDRRLNLFGYECRNCPRKFCIGCRYHR